MKKQLQHLTTTVTLFLLNAQVAIAAGTGGGIPAMEQPLTTVADSMTGPVARGFVMVSVVMAGVTYMFTDHGTGMRQASKIALGGGLTMKAIDVMASLGWAGATF
jgi:type IV secretion system protein TrbC